MTPILFLWVGITQSFASERLPGKTFGLGAVGGFPQFIGLDLSFVGWSFFVPGISFGSAPIDGILNNSFRQSPVALGTVLTDTYNIYPRATYTLYSGSFYLKYIFPRSGFFLGTLFSSVTFNANIQGDLKNEDTGGVSYSAVSGTATLTQLMLGLTFGYQFVIGSSFFIETALGGGYLLNPIYSITVNGTATSAVSVLPGGDAAFNNAKAQVQTSFDSAVATYRNALKFVPFAFLTIGFSF